MESKKKEYGYLISCVWPVISYGTMEVKRKRKSKEIAKEISEMGIRGGGKKIYIYIYNRVYGEEELNMKVERKSRYANMEI